MDEPTGKRCTKCGETKPLSEFHRDRAKPDGLAYWCKKCRCECARRWAADNPDRAKENHRRWEEANPERARELRRRWNSTHPEAIRAASRRWREANPEASLESIRRWQAANPGVARRWRRTNREAARESARRRHAANRKAVFDHYGRVCACCGTAERLGMDHVNGDGKTHRAQIGMGSSHLYRWLIANGFPEGFQVLCGRCNKSKADGERCRLDHEAA